MTTIPAPVWGWALPAAVAGHQEARRHPEHAWSILTPLQAAIAEARERGMPEAAVGIFTAGYLAAYRAGRG